MSEKEIELWLFISRKLGLGATIMELFKNSLGPLGRQFPPPSKLSQIVYQPKLFLNKLFYGLWRVALKG